MNPTRIKMEIYQPQFDQQARADDASMTTVDFIAQFAEESYGEAMQKQLLMMIIIVMINVMMMKMMNMITMTHYDKDDDLTS